MVGAKSPLLSPFYLSNSGICLLTVIKLGMIILCGKNFSNLAKQFMMSQLLFKHDVISDFHGVLTAKTSVIVILLYSYFHNGCQL